MGLKTRSRSGEGAGLERACVISAEEYSSMESSPLQLVPSSTEYPYGDCH